MVSLTESHRVVYGSHLGKGTAKTCELSLHRVFFRDNNFIKLCKANGMPRLVFD